MPSSEARSSDGLEGGHGYVELTGPVRSTDSVYLRASGLAPAIATTQKKIRAVR